MKYFGIKKPKNKYTESFIFWFSVTEHDAWVYFFNRSTLKQCYNGGVCPNGICMADAIKAYEAIGYKCVEVDLTEKIINKRSYET